MDIGQIITTMPGWALFSLIIVVSVLTAEFGVWLEQKTLEKSVSGVEDSPSSTATGSMLGLLAFILGFTFSITSSRFADRKQLVIDEANAIATSYLRTSFLPQMQQQEIRELYREYTSILVQLNRASDLEKPISRMEELHTLIWNQTASLSQEEMDSELRSLFIASVNEVIDLYGERKTVALTFRIPNILWNSLFALFLLCMFSLGYHMNTKNKRGIFDLALLAASFTLVITLIADMDSTIRARNFRVSQQPLIEVQKMIEKNSP